MRIQVVFLTDIPPRYRAGEVRAVAAGYARNFLFPKEMAVPATAEHRKRIEKIKVAAEVRRTRESQETQVIAQILNEMTVTIKARAGDRGRLYGSVTTMAIAEAITRDSGHEVDRRLIHLAEPIRELGTFPVTIRLHQDVAATVNVAVEDESGRQRARPVEPPEEALEAVESATEPVDELETASAEEATEAEPDEPEAAGVGEDVAAEAADTGDDASEDPDEGESGS